MGNQSEMIIYQTEDGLTKVNVTFEADTVWLSLDQMAELFQRDKSVISRHIRNIFSEGELVRDSVVAKNATTAADGKNYQVEYYNLDVIFTQGHEVTIRTISEKDGYLILNEGGQDEVYLFESVDMNYWIMDDNDNTWTEFAVVSVPFSEHLLFLDDIDPATGEALLTPTVHNKADFLAIMDKTDDPGFDIRNVMVAFDEHGELALIRRYYVPWQ